LNLKTFEKKLKINTN